MAGSFVLMALSPTLLMMQAMQVTRRVTQYAIARPSREICFTVVEQESRYKAKNVIDVVVYRLGDVTSAWVQAGIRLLGFGTGGGLGVGLIATGFWAVSAWTLGRQYERRQEQLGSAEPLMAPAGLYHAAVCTSSRRGAPHRALPCRLRSTPAPTD